MERPVTDIVFVGTLDKVPVGYTAVQNCPCGHSAQLWEKVAGGEAGTRFLCYSKENQSDDQVIEDMYIPGSAQQYLKKEYRIIKDTVEGDEPMRHKQLAVKKVARTQATKVIVDVIICRSKDSISKLYTKLMKVNGCQIAFRTAKYDPSVSSSDPVANVSSAMDELVMSPENNHTGGGAVQVKMVDSLASSPPPPLSPSPQPAGPTPPLNGSATNPSATSTAPYPPPDQPTPQAPPTSPPFAPSSNYPPAPSYPTNGGSSSYSNAAPLPYQMSPVAPAQITPVGGSYNMGGAAYDTSIGFSFGGVTPTPSYNPSLPAPYNPYSQQQQQPSGYQPPPGYPPAPGYPSYPPAQGNSSLGQPQGGQNQGGSSGGYGFNM